MAGSCETLSIEENMALARQPTDITPEAERAADNVGDRDLRTTGVTFREQVKAVSGWGWRTALRHRKWACFPASNATPSPR